MQSNDLAGKWTYRSFRNNPTPVNGDLNALGRLLFAEAEFTFAVTGDTGLKGSIDWGGGGGLDLTGTIRPAAAGAPLTLEIVGVGRPAADPDASTEGWEYDYYAYGAHEWPNGIDQVPALVGSVIRAKPHGGAPAGYVASFYAVKKV